MAERRLNAFAALAGLVLAAPTPAAEPPVPFEAVFEVYRNDKLIGESRFLLTVDGERWVMATDTTGTKGLAKFLGLEESSESRGRWMDGAPRPERFEQTVEVSFKTIRTTATFDWAAGAVRSVHEDGEDLLPLSPGVLDPVSAGLVIRSGLAEGEREWRLSLVDEDEIEEQHFRNEEQAPLETALGCLDTHRVDRLRGPESTRYTRTWYADELSWVPVKVAHGKTDGDRMESRIASLTVNGEMIAPGPACP